MIQSNKNECYYCGRPTQCMHHIIYGTANRKISDELGLVVGLCNEHHNMSNNSVHMNAEMSEELKKTAQRDYEENIGTREEWMRLFMKNYLWEEGV